MYSQTSSVPSVLWRCWLGGRKGIRPIKNMGGWWRWALVSQDGVAPSQMVSVSASVNSSSSSSSSRNEYYLGGTIALLLQDHRTVSTTGSL